MSHQALLALNARLVEAEVNAGVGNDWFSSWLNLLRTVEDGSISPELDALARRLDAVIQAVTAQNSAGKQTAEPVAEKRSQSELGNDPLLEPAKKSTGVDTAEAVEAGPTPKSPVLMVESGASTDTSSPTVPSALPDASLIPSSSEVTVVSEKIKESATSEDAIPEPSPKVESKAEAVPEPPVETKAAAAPEPTVETKAAAAPEPSVETKAAPEPSPKAATPVPEAPKSKLAAFLSVVEPPKVVPPSSPSKPAPSPATKAAAAQAQPAAAVQKSAQPALSASPPKQAAAAPTSPSNPSKFAAFESVSSPPVTTKSASPPSPSVSKTDGTVRPATSPAPATSPSQAASPSQSSKPSGTVAAAAPAKEESAKPSTAKQSEGGHMEVPQEAFDLFQEVKIRKKHRFVIFRIHEWKLEIVKVGDRSATFEDFMKELPFSDCRFAVYDHEKMKSDQYGNRKAEKVFFVTWQPVPAPTTHKMLYSTERRTLTAVFKGVEEIVATKRDDVLVATGVKDKFAAEDSEDEERGGNDDWMDD